MKKKRQTMNTRIGANLGNIQSRKRCKRTKAQHIQTYKGAKQANIQK